jgi:hypothetical protein
MRFEITSGATTCPKPAIQMLRVEFSGAQPQKTPLLIPG